MKSLDAPSKKLGRSARATFWLGMIFTLSSSVLWGTTYPIIRIILYQYNAYDISLYRALLATLSLLIYFLLTKELKQLRPRKKDLPLLLAGSVLGASGFWELLNLAVQYLEPDTTSFLVALYPLIAIVLSFLMLHEKITIVKILGVFAGLVGTLVIIFIGEGAGFKGVQPLLGSFLAIAASLSWAGYMISTKLLVVRNAHVTQEKKLGAEYITFQNFLFAIPVTFVLVLWTGSAQSFVAFHPNELLLLCYMGIITSGIAFLLFNRGIAMIGVNASAINQLTFPAVAVVTSYLLLGETVNLAEGVGMLLIVAGILAAQLVSK